MYKILSDTLFLGKSIVYVPECHSTSTLLLDLTQKSNLGEGTLVLTDNQRNGRGQRGSAWEAEPGKNLTFSFLLKPSFVAVAEQFRLTMVISLGVADYLIQRISGETKIKWPNDLLVDGKKIGGILIENTLAGSQLQQSVVGIGLNVNQIIFSIDSATSMQLVADHEFDLNHELNLLLERLEKRYLQLRAGRYNEIRDEYLRLLYWKGEEHLFSANREHWLGVIEGVDEIGKLKVSSKGEIRSFGLKEIQFLR